MTTVLSLLMVNAVLGAWDTLWYHEYRARLTAKLFSTRPELRLHVARDVVYVGLYGFFAMHRPAGLVVLVVIVAIAMEVAITLCDFVVEDRDRHIIGGMAAGERVLHSLMAIVYGAMLAHLVPELLAGAGEATGASRHDAPIWLSLSALAVAFGIGVSGIRDALALRGFDPVWSQGSTGHADAWHLDGADRTRRGFPRGPGRTPHGDAVP